MKITLKRAGHFQCYWRSAEGLCGGHELSPEYKYSCEIEAADVFDKNGFIYDQLKIDAYFQTKYSRTVGFPYHEPLSCELIAKNAVLDIMKSLVRHYQDAGVIGYKIYRITVSISVQPPAGVRGEASISAEWRKDDV